MISNQQNDYRNFGIQPRIAELVGQIDQEIRGQVAAAENSAKENTRKILAAFLAEGVSEYHLSGSHGYGYADAGREVLDSIYARIFEAPAALVRIQVVSGTHALALALFSIFRAGDEMIIATGLPYPTLWPVIGLGKYFNQPDSLMELGVRVKIIALDQNDEPDLEAIAGSITKKTRGVLIQRSSGYDFRRGLSTAQIGALIHLIKQRNPLAACIVDNCYGEFVEVQEPTQCGADLIVGSLLKNPGGSLAPTGGYFAGETELIQAISRRLTAPGLEGNVGPTLGIARSIFQGLFLAPHFVGQALAGSIFAAKLFELLGCEVKPRFNDRRGDLIQAIQLGTVEALEAFCASIQACSPIDSKAKPYGSVLPGYDDTIIMAGGTFVQGATLELSADAPVREPFIVFMQGGLIAEHTRTAALFAASELLRAGFLRMPE